MPQRSPPPSPPTNVDCQFTITTKYRDYVLNCRQAIANAQRQVTGISPDRLVAINAPFEWHPEEHFHTKHGYKRAVILLHGLNESAFSLRDIGHHLVEQGFLVRGALLPGHGSTPESLLKVKYSQWLTSVKAMIANTHQYAQEVYICGFSLGSTLAMHAALEGETIAGLILFAPALAAKNPLSYLSRWGKFAAENIRNKTWRQKQPEVDYAKYCSSSYHCVHEVLHGMKQVRHLLKQKKLNTRVFAIATDDDETIDTRKFIREFMSWPPTRHQQLLLYASKVLHNKLTQHPHITVRNSIYPQQKILSYAHTSLHCSPDNQHYGRNADYYDYLHYASPPHNSTRADYLGAINSRSLRKKILARLHYNPDFTFLLQQLDLFLNK